jgi:hypothetical protein
LATVTLSFKKIALFTGFFGGQAYLSEKSGYNREQLKKHCFMLLYIFECCAVYLI